MSSPEDVQEFQQTLASEPHLQRIDSIHLQVRDLIESDHPSEDYSDVELDALVREKTGPEPDQYGVWVHYPWSRRVVHLLPEQEFIRMRTNRNLYKIKPSEQESLSQKTIGLIGLSVGHAVAMSLALERSFGKLRIADFDVLDLSNLNRIRTNVYRIGVPKTDIVMQEIAELDPYLYVESYPEGLKEENMDEFLQDIDLLIDECDSIDIKISVREKARAQGIPVIMETSDRGMLDIERYDLDSELPILHGLAEGLDSQKLKGLTNEEKIPYVLPIIGLEKSSLGLRASMVEIEKSISTWPQLGTDVLIGGGTVGYVTRRLLTGENVPNGRFYVDLDTIIRDQVSEETEASSEPALLVPNPQALMAKAKRAWNSPPESEVSREIAERLIAKAAKAPSGGNVQPWLWHPDGNRIHLFMDNRKEATFLDFGRKGTYLGLGAAAENLYIAAAKEGLAVKTHWFEHAAEEPFPLVAGFELTPASGLEDDALFDFIDLRVTNRLNEGRRPLPNTTRERFFDTFRRKNTSTDFHLIEDAHKLEVIKDVLSIADRLIMMNQKGHSDLYNELRWNTDFSERIGINVHSLGLTPLEMAGMRIAKDDEVIDTLRELEGGDRFSEMNHKCMDSSSGMGLVTMKDYDPLTYFNSGMDIQRLWLQGTADGVSMHPMSGVTFLINRTRFAEGEGLSQDEQARLMHCQKLITEAFDLDIDTVLCFMFRFSITDNAPIPSNRKPLNEIILTNE